MADRLAWIITIGETEQPLPPNDRRAEIVRSAVARERGSITANRAGSAEKLTLRFNKAFGLLEHWASDDGPVCAARFPNRATVTEAPVELPCCNCGIALEVPQKYVLAKTDAVRLFLQFLDSGVLPAELAEHTRATVQLLLPGLEEFVVPQAVLNAVTWEPL
jgi:hypothetical protein